MSFYPIYVLLKLSVKEYFVEEFTSFTLRIFL